MKTFRMFNEFEPKPETRLQRFGHALALFLLWLLSRPFLALDNLVHRGVTYRGVKRSEIADLENADLTIETEDAIVQGRVVRRRKD